MPFSLAPCVSDDMDQAFSVVSEGFGNEHPYFEYVFPRHRTPAGRKAGGERFRAFMEADPNTTYLKVTDSESGSIVGVAKWNIYDGVIPEEFNVEGDYWESAYDKELAQDIFAGYLKPRRQAIKDAKGHLVSLDMMAVHPDYQRRGVGKLLLQWGIDIADKMKVKSVVEATRPGQKLYQTAGFDVEDELYVVKLSDRFSDRDTQTFTWMVRPVQG